MWSYGPGGCFIPKQTGRLTVGCNIRLDTTYRSERVPRVEAGPNTSTVTLRVVGGKEKGSLKSRQ
jgi:hypothetical protein